MRAPTVLLGAGSLAARPDNSKEFTVDFPVRSLPTTFQDKNGNYELDAPAEQRGQQNLEAAVLRKRDAQKPETDGRALVLADSDALSDALVVRPANAQLALDGLKWVLGDEAISGETSSEVDVPITHTKKQDVVWFYSTIFLGPGLVLVVGWLANRRRSGKKEAA
jgi:hypothetical protein